MNAVVSSVLLKKQFAENVFLWMHITFSIGLEGPNLCHFRRWMGSMCQLGLAEDEGSHRASARTHLLLEMSKLLVM